MSNDMDQDKLAEEWAAALAEQEDTGLDDEPMDMLGGKAGMSSDDAWPRNGPAPWPRTRATA